MKGLNSLPEGIVLDILTRVPTESVLECKLVCKPWRDLIRHQSFSQLHFNHFDSADDPGNPSFIFITGENKELYYTEYDENCHETPFNRKARMNLNPPVKNCSVVGSSNGLICFNEWCTGVNGYEDRYGPAYICNPITREYVILPNTEGDYMWSGFGYSHSTNEYKVVRICFDSDAPNFGIPQVYTLGSGNGWRNLGELDTKLKNMERLILCAGTFANGALHWVNHDEQNILAFDLTDEKFSELPPPPCGVPDFAISLGVLGDFLSATYYSGGCELWLLKKNKDNCNELSWSEEFRFDRFDSYISLPFGYTKSGNLLFYGHSKIYVYDPEASSTTMDVNFGKVISDVISHKNTLVSLKILGEKDTKTMESDERATEQVQVRS